MWPLGLNNNVTALHEGKDDIHKIEALTLQRILHKMQNVPASAVAVAGHSPIFKDRHVCALVRCVLQPLKQDEMLVK